MLSLSWMLEPRRVHRLAQYCILGRVNEYTRLNDAILGIINVLSRDHHPGIACSATWKYRT